MPQTIHYTELPSAKPGDTFEEEWETYRVNVGQWLTDGLEGKHVLIKGTEVLGFWNSREEALFEGYTRFPAQPFLVRQILAREPLLRISGILRRWLN
jgi:hypothetical protein